jgi:hypothetical protein
VEKGNKLVSLQDDTNAGNIKLIDFGQTKKFLGPRN